MRRVIGSLLVAVALLLTACGGSSAPAQSESGGPAQQSQQDQQGEQAQQGQGKEQQSAASQASEQQAASEQEDAQAAPAGDESGATTQPVSDEQAEWNESDPSAYTNGNIEVAVSILQNESPDSLKKKAKTVKPSALQKAPWKHYGQVVRATGTVAIVQELPPNSDIGAMLGLGSEEFSEIVFMTDDMSATIDYIHLGSSGDIEVGDRVTVYGYPVGLVEVPNQLGGMSTQVLVVGKVAEEH